MMQAKYQHKVYPIRYVNSLFVLWHALLFMVVACDTFIYITRGFSTD